MSACKDGRLVPAPPTRMYAYMYFCTCMCMCICMYVCIIRSKTKACLIACRRDGDSLAHKDAQVLGRHLAPMIAAGVMQQARGSRCDVATATCGDFQVPAQGGRRDLEAQMVGQYLSWLPDALVRGFGEATGGEHLLDQIPSRQGFGARWQGTAGVVDVPKAPDPSAAHGLGKRLDDFGPQERRVGVPEGQRGTTALDHLISRAVGRGDPTPNTVYIPIHVFTYVCIMYAYACVLHAFMHYACKHQRIRVYLYGCTCLYVYVYGCIACILYVVCVCVHDASVPSSTLGQ